MKRTKGILPNKADLDARVRGDCLGVASDRGSLEALALAVRRRHRDNPTEATAKQLEAIEESLRLSGASGEGGP